MEVQKPNELIELYCKQIRKAICENEFNWKSSELNDCEWAEKEFGKAEKQFKIFNPIAIILVIVMVLAVLSNQFGLTQRLTNHNALVVFILCTVGFYLQIERIKKERNDYILSCFFIKLRSGYLNN
jgi:hypothetical protein